MDGSDNPAPEQKKEYRTKKYFDQKRRRMAEDPEYAKRVREKWRENANKYYEKNKSRIQPKRRQQARNKSASQREQRRKYLREWLKRNREQSLRYYAEYRDKKRERIRELGRNFYYRAHPTAKITSVLRKISHGELTIAELGGSIDFAIERVNEIIHLNTPQPGDKTES